MAENVSSEDETSGIPGSTALSITDVTAKFEDITPVNSRSNSPHQDHLVRSNSCTIENCPCARLANFPAFSKDNAPAFENFPFDASLANIPAYSENNAPAFGIFPFDASSANIPTYSEKFKYSILHFRHLYSTGSKNKKKDPDCNTLPSAAEPPNICGSDPAIEPLTFDENVPVNSEEAGYSSLNTPVYVGYPDNPFPVIESCEAIPVDDDLKSFIIPSDNYEGNVENSDIQSNQGFNENYSIYNQGGLFSTKTNLSSPNEKTDGSKDSQNHGSKKSSNKAISQTILRSERVSEYQVASNQEPLKLRLTKISKSNTKENKHGSNKKSNLSSSIEETVRSKNSHKYERKKSSKKARSQTIWGSERLSRNKVAFDQEPLKLRLTKTSKSSKKENKHVSNKTSNTNPCKKSDRKNTKDSLKSSTQKYTTSKNKKPHRKLNKIKKSIETDKRYSSPKGKIIVSIRSKDIGKIPIQTAKQKSRRVQNESEENQPLRLRKLPIPNSSVNDSPNEILDVETESNADDINCTRSTNDSPLYNTSVVSDEKEAEEKDITISSQKKKRQHLISKVWKRFLYPTYESFHTVDENAGVELNWNVPKIKPTEILPTLSKPRTFSLDKNPVSKGYFLTSQQEKILSDAKLFSNLGSDTQTEDKINQKARYLMCVRKLLCQIKEQKSSNASLKGTSVSIWGLVTPGLFSHPVAENDSRAPS